MDHRWVEMQQHPPPPIPNPSSSSSSLDPYYAHYYNQPSSSYPQSHYYPSSYYNPRLPPPHPSHLPHQNPNPTIPPPVHSEPLDYHGGGGGGVPSVQYDAGLMPPGIDSYATTTINSYHPPPHPSSTHVGFEDHTSTVYAHPHTHSWTTASYYQNPNVVAQSLAAKEVVRQYGADPAAYAAVSARPPNVTESLVPANPNPTYWTNTVARPHINDAIRKKIKKTKVTKIVQSAWCEICKIDCTTRDVLDKHRMGKKHKKNLEKIEELRRNVNPPNTVPVPVPIPVPVPVTKNPVIGPLVNPSGVKTQNAKKSRKKASSASGEDVETKKRKVLEGGAAAEAVRVCKICNVVCNSQTVFNYHLAGQKHISLAKSHAGGMATAGA